MSLRFKVFLVIGLVSVSFLFLMNQSISYIIGKDFSDLEQREATDNALRVTDALQNKVDQLAVKLGDWAQWDDTYQFMIDHNEAYLQSNLQNEAFDLLQINTVALIDPKGDVVFKKQVRDGKDEPFSSGFENHLKEDVVEEYIHSQGIHKEVEILPEGVMMYVARPITSSDGTAPANGFIVFGYFFEGKVVADLARITHLQVEFSVYGSRDTRDDFSVAWKQVSAENPLFIESTKDTSKISTYAFVGDDHDNPVLLLRITMNRDIYQKGQEGIALFTRFTIVAILVFCGVIFLLLNKLVLRKIALLRGQVEKIRESGNMDVSVFLSGKDEFSSLAERISEMLKALHDVEVKRKESEKRFRTVADSAPVMIWMSDTEKKCTYVNRVWLDFTGRSLEEELGMGWVDRVNPEDLKKGWSVFDEAFAGRKPFAVEYRMRRFDGADRWLFMRGIPNIAEEGSFSGYLGSAVDITERKQTEEQQRMHTEEIERVNRLMVERELKMIELKEKIKELESHVSKK